MTQLLFLTGAPGSGKSTVAAMLHEKLGSPWFEFGWIPEFRRLNPHTEMSWEEEEALSAENLALVVENYLRHGFENIVISDLSDAKIVQMYEKFGAYERKIIRLFCEDDETRHRVLTRDNGNEYRDADAAVAISHEIAGRTMLDGELAFDSCRQTPEEIVREILCIL